MLLPFPVKETAERIEPFEYSLLVPHDARAVRVARTTLRAALLAHELGELIGRAELLANEMLTNAIVHTSGTAELSLWWSEWRVLRVTVRDNCPRPPTPRAVRPYGENGRGLRLLQALADRWGHAPSPGGGAKSVWCEISRA
ncbi:MULTISPECIES: ATP-binding protein [Streptomyces]|uniref:Histidine kinase/HSP90-like ATPase domain-containing protein n=1 Tax=Streptomyces luteosporeus TaxID=173856 RepID=A0ABP6GME5_9ACTN